MLSDKEKQEVELIFDRIMDLNGKDKTFFQLYIRTIIKRNLGFDLMNRNPHNPDRIAATRSFWPPNDPHWYKMNFSASGAAASGSSSGATTGGSDKKAAEPEKTPAKEVQYIYNKKKSAFDLVLEKFDAGKKINLIKEVRGMFNLGLKDVE
jgi:hypothetical protein